MMNVLLSLLALSATDPAATVAVETPVAAAVVAAFETRSDTARELLRRVNREVNNGVRFRAEGRDRDNWQIAQIGGAGDCEDFALLKRQMLITAGWPAEDLKIIFVYKRSVDAELGPIIEGHAALYSNANQLVLDSPVDGDRNATIVPIEATTYFGRMGWRMYCTAGDLSLGTRPADARCLRNAAGRRI